MSAPRCLVTLPPWPRSLTCMGTRDTVDHSDDGDSRPDRPFKVLIGKRLHELADTLGLNQRQLAQRCGIDPRHFSAFWLDNRAASFEILLKVARGSGRSIGWLCGEEGTRPVLGTVDAHGRVPMAITPTSPGVLVLAGPTAFFPGSTKLFVEPFSTFEPSRWLYVRHVGSDDAWLAWAYRAGKMDMLQVADGEILVFQPGRHAIIGLISGTVVDPPAPPSAPR